MRLEAHLVIVAPHPDDETLAFGGALYDHLRRGGSAEVIAVTDGEAADDDACERARLDLARLRASERDAAFEQLEAGRVGVTRLGFRDRTVGDDEQLLERALRSHFTWTTHSHPRASVVLPWRDDPHPDHRATGGAGIRAAVRAGLPYVEVPIWGWYHRPWRRRLPAARLRRIPITPEARNAKRAALACFSSQLELLPGGRGPVLPADFLGVFDRPYETVLA